MKLLLLPTAVAAFSIGARVPLPSRARGLVMQVADADAPPSTLNSIRLTNAAGDVATVATFGACVTSYVKDGVDALMIRPDAKLDGSKPISGGIPHCFPQFGPGAMQQHGFARNLEWAVCEQTDEKLVLLLTESEYTLAMWPHSFEAKYTVSLKDDSLATELCVTNTGDSNFDFTAALHSYWAVSDINAISISSPELDGAAYLDKTASPPADATSGTDTLTISQPVDSVYKGVAGDVAINDPKRGKPLVVRNQLGWEDTVVWNPFGDENMGYQRFVCIESAKAAAPVVLGPSEYWVGAMDVVA